MKKLILLLILLLMILIWLFPIGLSIYKDNYWLIFLYLIWWLPATVLVNFLTITADWIDKYY